MSLCAMCLESMDYKSEFLKLQIENLKLKKEVIELKQLDSCIKQLKDLPYNNVIEIERKMHFPLQIEESTVCKFITLTFDPKKFPILSNRTAQRSYIKQSLEQLIKTDYGCNYKLGDLYGCYELHDSGIVHAHFVIQHIHIEELAILKREYTNNPNNSITPHVCNKNYREAVDYINKKETKDLNNMCNWFIFRKTFSNIDLKVEFYKKLKKPLENSKFTDLEYINF